MPPSAVEFHGDTGEKLFGTGMSFFCNTSSHELVLQITALDLPWIDTSQHREGAKASDTPLNQANREKGRNHMNKALVAAVTTALVALAPTAHAVAVSNSFNVSVNLSSQCRALNSGTLTVDFGTYTAFQAGAATGSNVNIDFECTRGFAPVSVAFDTVNGLATGEGVLAGLQYTLSSAAAVVTGGTAATTATIGTGDNRRYVVSGTMPAGQAGTAPGGAATHVRQLIVTY
jgi:spore coat protein U-like protein